MSLVLFAFTDCGLRLQCSLVFCGSSTHNDYTVQMWPVYWWDQPGHWTSYWMRDLSCWLRHGVY